MSRCFGIVIAGGALLSVSAAIGQPNVDQAELFARDPNASGGRPRAAVTDESASMRDRARGFEQAEVRQADDRWPVPPAASREAAVRRVREIFRAEYGAAKTAQAKSALAKQLLQQAAACQDPVDHWGLLGEAGSLAIDGGDVALASQAVQQVIDSYRLDRSQTQLDVYQRLLKTANAAQAGQLGRSVLSLADTALKSGDTAVAREAAVLATSVARKARDPELVKASNALRQELKERDALEAKTQALREKLVEAPNDPDASRELGLILYLNDINAVEGLRLLRLSADPALARLADLELKEEGAGSDKLRVAVADGWYDWSRSATGTLRSDAEAKALSLYLAISPTLQGLESARISKRIGELQKGMGVKGVATPLITVPMGERTGGSALFLNGLCNGVKFTVNGKEWPQSLYYAPKDNSTCIMKFSLPGTHRRFQGHAGIFTLPDTSPNLQPGAALIFSVWADGREVWRSKPLSKRDQIQAYSVDIAGARSLELHTTSTGVAVIPWAAWLDPELVE